VCGQAVDEKSMRALIVKSLCVAVGVVWKGLGRLVFRWLVDSKSRWDWVLRGRDVVRGIVCA